MGLINAADIKVGNSIIVDNSPCIVRSIDISKTGKHGAAKCRIEAIRILDSKKKVIAVPGHERFETPLIKKLKAQVLNIQGEKASVMDLESFETFDVLVDSDISDLKENDNVEYWDIDGKKIAKRKM